MQKKELPNTEQQLVERSLQSVYKIYYSYYIFFKQWGTWDSDGIRHNKQANGKVLDGEVVQQKPE